MMIVFSDKYLGVTLGLHYRELTKAFLLEYTTWKILKHNAAMTHHRSKIYHRQKKTLADVMIERDRLQVFIDAIVMIAENEMDKTCCTIYMLAPESAD